MGYFLPFSLHAMLMQLWFCSAQSVIFKTSSGFLSRNMKILEIFLTELESSSLYLCSLNRIFYSIACEGRISVGVKCFMSVWIIFLFLPSKGFFVVFIKCWKLSVHGYSWLFSTLILPLFKKLFLKIFWLPFPVFRWFTYYWEAIPAGHRVMYVVVGVKHQEDPFKSKYLQCDCLLCETR